MRILALVTARGGSKGLPGKNLARIAGRPLVAWSHRAIDGLRRDLAADASTRHIELLCRLSTDDPAIAEAWPESDRPSTDDLRPAHLATDSATSLEVVDAELRRATELGTPCDAVLLVQPTSPLLTAEDLRRMLDRMIGEGHGGAESVAAIAELDHPMHWNMILDHEGRLLPAAGTDDAQRTAPRQSHTQAFRPVGCYLCSARFLSEHASFWMPGITHGVEIPRRRAIDIDDATDLAVARALAADPQQHRAITIGNGAGARTIGDGHPCFVIAEAGVNHNGDPDLAHELVDAAADAGADAVKFQTFRASEIVTSSGGLAAYQRTNLGIASDAQASQADMLRALELAGDALGELKAHAEERGLVFLSSPFDIESAHLLHELGVAAFKIGSGELTNHPFLARLAELGTPILLSTGMATLREAEDAHAVLRAHARGHALRTLWFHCVSAYPAPVSASNLRAMESLRTALGAPVGMSDHSMGDAVAIAAVARGAASIEKHITLSRAMEGPDHAASLEPEQFADMVQRIRLVESALGDGIKQPAACEFDTISAARRSLVAAADLPRGHRIRAHDLIAKRPGDGICPSRAADLIGRTLATGLVRDQQIAEADLSTTDIGDDRSVA